MCPACGAAWDIEPARIPAKGMRLRCPACGEWFAFGAADVRPPPNPDVELIASRDKAGVEEKWELAEQLTEQLAADRRARIVPKADVGDPIEGLRALCAASGFDLDAAERSFVERVRVLAEHSRTVDDARRMAAYAERVFRHYEAAKPAEAFDALERQTVVLACLFSDIGKTGPAGAGVEDARLVAEAFGVENVRDDSQSVATFLRTYFSADAEHRVARFAALGIDPSMSLRQFWNLHSGWTLAITEAGGLPPEACAAAATHHFLDDVNPRAIVDVDDRFTRRFGKNHRFDRAEKLVIVLDKYDAAIRRSGLSRDRAIAWLRARIEKSDRFRDDEVLTTLVADVDAALAD